MKRLLVFFLVFQSIVFRCSWSMPTVDKAFKTADAVFVARVVDVTGIKSPEGSIAKKDFSGKSIKESRSVYTLDVSSMFKGQVSVWTKIYGDFTLPCSEDVIPFVKGQEYIFFAYYRPAKQWLKKGDNFPDMPKPDDKIIMYLGVSTTSSIDFKLFNELGRLAEPYPPLPIR